MEKGILENIEDSDCNKQNTLEKVITQLKGAGKSKKIIDIEEYLNERFEGLECELSDSEDLLKYSHLPFEDEDYEYLFSIIHQTYSRGEPYFLFELDALIKPFNEFWIDIKENLSTKKRDSSCYKYQFSYNKENFVEDNKGSIRINYTQYRVYSTSNGLQRSGETNYGYFDCEFRLEKKVMLIGTGNKILAQTFYNYLCDNFYTQLSLKPFKLMPYQFNYKGPMEANRVTIFFLALITKCIQDERHIINDYKKIGFYNPSGQHVKSIKLSGNALLDSIEVAEQIKNGLTLKLLEFNMTWVINPTLKVTADIVIDSQSIMKIIIKEIDNFNFKSDILLYIYNKMKELISTGISSTIAFEIFDNYINKTSKKSNLEKNKLINDVTKKLISDTTLNNHSDIITKILEEFR